MTKFQVLSVFAESLRAAFAARNLKLVSPVEQDSTTIAYLSQNALADVCVQVQAGVSQVDEKIDLAIVKVVVLKKPNWLVSTSKAEIEVKFEGAFPVADYEKLHNAVVSALDAVVTKWYLK